VTLVELYDQALPQVYGYLVARCGDRAVAEDLTSETFLAVVGNRQDQPLTVGWLVGIARHKLMDHWRRQAREERLLHAVEGLSGDPRDPWEVELDRVLAHQVLGQLAPQHRSVLTLRYLDGLPVPQAANILDRSVAATEALLVRARREFRHVYEGSRDA
jgi:RNA polymerase sigma-70 factor (ECF subfamily)